MVRGSKHGDPTGAPIGGPANLAVEQQGPHLRKTSRVPSVTGIEILHRDKAPTLGDRFSGRQTTPPNENRRGVLVVIVARFTFQGGPAVGVTQMVGGSVDSPLL